MPFLSNSHTHSLYCDGADAPRDMVQEALSRGFVSLGFSGHSYLPQDGSGMSPENTELYIREIRRLQQEYQGKIRIYLGLELDSFSTVDLTPYEYLVGSVHCTYDPENNERLAYDKSSEDFFFILDHLFQGDVRKLSRHYYRQVAENVIRHRPSILGHFNLITKYNEEFHYLDEDDPVYRSLAGEALLASAKTGAVTEINTGAMARGRTSVPYPNLWMLKLLHEHHYPITVSSDCHDRNKLTFGFDKALEIAREAGYHSVYRLRPDTPVYEVPHHLSQEELFEEVSIID